MTLDIRPDYCIALRMIALQEHYRRQAEIVDELFASLGPEIKEAIDDINDGQELWP